MRLTVIGCGYVGLVTGACLAAAGHEVFCTDTDVERINQLKAGKVPIYEEHLDAVLTRAVAEGRISYTADAAEAIQAGEVIFICVGTPPKAAGQPTCLPSIMSLAKLRRTHSPRSSWLKKAQCPP